MEGGNNLEQATALVAAANRVVQDPNSVGSALRTISLRLRGTSVEILEEMGEETDNVVESTSKLQEKIKALSGVDILTNTGDYKDTYTILKEIGQVWEDMSDIDQAALLELMAGKNRANTLSAILSNMKDLEGAYESALNAEGSAIKENEAHLDSIQGRIDLFNNSVQTMWMNFINADVVKFIVSIGTGLVNLVDDIGLLEIAFTGLLTYFNLSKKNNFDLASILGIHNLDEDFLHGFSALGDQGLTGFITKFFNKIFGKKNNISKEIKDNIHDSVVIDTKEIDAEIDSVQSKLKTARNQLFDIKGYDGPFADETVKNDDDDLIAQKTQEVKELETQLANLQAQRDKIVSDATPDIATSIMGETDTKEYHSMLSVLEEIEGKTLEIGDEQHVSKVIDGMSDAAKIGQVDLANYVSTLDDADIALKAYAASVQDGNYSLAGFQQFIAKHNASIKASGIAAKSAAVGHQLLNAALSMGVAALASIAIQALVSGLNKLINKSKEAAKTAEEAINAYNETQTTLREQKITIDELAASYEKLSKGVDLNTNENINLTTSSYEEYLDVCNDIADMYPHLVTGFDVQGNAILSLKGNVDQLTQAYKEAAQAARQKAIASGGDIFDTFKNTYSSDPSATWDTTGLDQQIKLAKKLQELINDGNQDEINEFFNDLNSGNIEIDGQKYSNIEFDDLAKAAGIDQSFYKNWFARKTKIDMGAFEQQSNKLLSFIKSATTSINTETNKVKTLMDAYLGEDLDYAALSEKSRSFINQIVSGLNAEFIHGFDSADALYNWIKTNIVDAFQDPSVIDAINDLSSLQLEFAKGDINYADYQKQLTDYLSKIQNKFDDDSLAQIKIGIGIDEQSLQTAWNHTLSLLGNNLDAVTPYIDKVSSLSVEDLQIAAQLEVPDGTILSWEELQQEIEKTKIAATQDFDITNFTDAISSHSAVISEYQEAIQKLDKGSFTMDDFMELIKKYPDLAKGVDISSNAFYGLSRNLNRAIKTSTKSFIKDLKELKVSLVAAGKSTDSIDQLIEAIENMPDDALDDIIEKYSTLAEKINKAKTAQDQLLASMEENPNEGYETRGEAMEYMKEAMAKGEIGSESNLWNVAEKYGFTYDSAKTINENADALAKYIAIREKWFKQDDDGDNRTNDGYSYEGTENFIKDVESAAENSEELQKYLTWDYDENSGVLNFDYNNKDWDTIVSILSKTKELAGLTSDEFADLMIQVGQYFGIEWGNYDDAVDHLNEIADGSADAKTKAEEYGKYMQDYFGKNTEIDLTARPMVDSKTMQEAGWEGFKDGDYATLYSGSYSSDDNSVAISVTPILPDGKVLDPKSLEKYATEIANGTDPAEVEIVYKDKETGEEKKYTGKDIFLNRFTGTNKEEQASQYGVKLSEAQAGYDQLRDTLGINTILAEKGIDGLKEISELQGVVETNSKGITVINEEAFTSALEEANYTEDQIDLIIEKIKTLNEEAFNVDFLKIDDTLDKNGVSALKEISELQGAIQEDTDTGITILDTDMFAPVLEEAGYTESQIDSLIKKIQEYNNVVSVSGDTDPLGLGNASLSVDSLKASLGVLGITYDEVIGKWGDGKKDLKINVQYLDTTLKEKGWTDEAIRDYCLKLSETNLEGFNIKVNQEEIDEAIKKANEVPEEENTEYTITGTGLSDLKLINDELNKIPSTVSTQYTITETTVKETKTSGSNAPPSSALGSGRPTRVNGTAHAEGSWGAPKDETSLVGELGPELLVRNGRWTTIGENGAEFTGIKKGDIIFNHKQTEELLKNGHVTSRGRAYASGTAYASGGGTFAKYKFSGSGGYTKYDVNDKVVESWGDLSGAINDTTDAASDAADEFEETLDWVEIRLEEINEQLDLMNAELENASDYASKNNIIDNIIDVNENKMANLTAGIAKYAEYAARLLNEIPAQYRDAAQNGAIAISEFVGEADEKTVEAINNYREWAQKVADLKQELEGVKTEIRELAIQKIDNAQNTGDLWATVEDSQTEKLQNQVDLLEESGEVVSSLYYGINGGDAANSTGMFENSYKKIEYLTRARNKMQEEFDDAVKSGTLIKGSDEWYENIDKLYQIDSEIDAATKEIEEFQNSINDLYWDNFDEGINRIDYIKDDAQSLIDLMDSVDMVTHSEDREYMPGGEKYWTADDVSWTDEGLATMGLYAQQMEAAEVQARQYAKAIDDLTADYEAGKYSESEYLEKLNELTSGQYDSIEAYYDAQDAIKDMNKARIDMIKEGIEKEIDAYEELINKKKEALSAEKDAHDFQKSVMEQQKDITDIRRQLSALDGDTSLTAMAKRKQLQAELAKAEYELEETYYDHSIEIAQEGLDKDLEITKETKEKEIEEWEKYLENVELVVADSLGIIQANAFGIYDTLSSKANEYNLTLSDAILTPWQDGSFAVSDYQTTFDTATSSTMDQLELINQKWQDIIDTTNKAAKASVDAINAENAAYAAANNPSKTSNTTTTSKGSSSSGGVGSGVPAVGSSVTVKGSATNFSSKSGGATMASFVPGGSYTVYQVSGSEVLIGRGGVYTGWVNKHDLVGYAKGTTGVKKDQLAWIDELGDELIIRPSNGRMTFLEKGTGVVPADLTANLMEWGKLDPSIMLDQNKPVISAPHVVNNNIELTMDIGEVVHIDTVTNDTIPNLTKAIDKQLDKYMKNLNNQVRKYSR